MEKVRELRYDALKNHCGKELFPFSTTAEIEALQGGIIGQERAVKAFDFGLQVKFSGYNIFMCGPFGTGKTTYAKVSTQRLAQTEAVPYDWCYVYHFQNPRSPQSLRFAPGQGKQFRDDMNELVQLFKTEIPKAFRSEEYEKQKTEIVRAYEEKRDVFMGKMSDMAKEHGFQVRTTNAGIYFMPVIDGKTIDEDAYDDLEEEVKAKIDGESVLMQEKAAAIMRDIRDLEKESKKQTDDLDYKVGLFAIGHHVNLVQEKYKEYERVIAYIHAVQEDVLENIGNFFEEEEEQDENLAALLPMLSKKQTEDITLKYKVNLIVDHSETKGAPVVIHFNPTYYNLVGEVEYDSEFGNLTTDFMKIKGGLFHKANGGYLILQAQDILTSPQSWEAIRRVIKTKEITMDGMRELMGAIVAPTLKPEPIPADMKVIIVGSNYYYDLLDEYDEEFHKFFKIKAEFDYEMKRSTENIQQISKFIKSFVEKEKTMDFDVTAVCAVVEESSRMAEQQNKLTTRFNDLSEILGEAVTWAKLDGASLVTGEYIKKAIHEKEQRLCMYEEKLGELLDDDVIMIDTEGEAIGQINGLAVLDMGSYCFGNPSRITATTYVGQSGIVNIEKEARMSGQTHDKGVQIISGFLGQTYAQEFPLSLSCRVCFEQNYNGIDGDSASSTELYCILSSLAEVPIRQDLAVTGSINQRGEIQAIGGVTYKIEGFFDLCKKRGLTGTQGVVMPTANCGDLMLKDEVVEAVKEGKFHIYPVSTLNEGIELLLQMPAGEKDQDGRFPKGSVHEKVWQKLKEYNEKSNGDKTENNKKEE